MAKIRMEEEEKENLEMASYSIDKEIKELNDYYQEEVNDTFEMSKSIKENNEEEDDENNIMKDKSSAVSRSSNFVLAKIRKFREFSGKLVNHELVQQFIVLLIAVNAIMMGVATFDFVAQNPSVDAKFELVDEIFLIIFTIELTFQFCYHGLRLFFDGWLVFDFCVIVVSWSFSSVQIIRAFRIFRALRLITRVKVMKDLVVAVLSVMPRMAAITLLLLLIFYIFAVMMTQLFGDLETSENYFGRLDHAFFTLFQIMTLDAWADVSREIMEVYFWAWIPFFIFVIVSGFVVVNLIIAVICDAVSALEDDVKAKIHGQAAPENEDDDENDNKNNNNTGLMSRGPSPSLKSSQQLEMLERQVDEITRVQDQTLKTLHLLMERLRQQQQQDLTLSITSEEEGTIDVTEFKDAPSSNEDNDKS